MAEIITTRVLDADQKAQIKALIDFLETKRPANNKKIAWYEAEARLGYYLNHIPAHMQGRTQAMGWPRQTVDNLASRCTFEGFGYENEFGLNDVFRQNRLNREFDKMLVDKFIIGTGFQVAGHGDRGRGEPDQLITTEHPNNVAVVYDGRLRRPTSGIVVRDIEGGMEGEFYTDGLRVPFTYKDAAVTENEGWNPHNYTRTPIVAYPHGEMTHRGIGGHSAITPTIIHLTEAMMEIGLGGQVLRELYSLPGLMILGGDKKQFVDPVTGEQTSAFSALQDAFTVLGNHVVTDEKTGETTVTTPSVQQLQTGDPGAFLSWAEHLTVRWAVEAAIPLHAAGVQTTNPSSADAIRLAEREGIRRAEAAISETEAGAEQIGWLAARGLHGDAVSPRWIPETNFREPSTPTRAAAADEVVKLVGAGILRPDSKVVLRRIALSRKEIEEVEEENAFAQQLQLSNMLREVEEPQPTLAPSFGTQLADSSESAESA